MPSLPTEVNKMQDSGQMRSTDRLLMYKDEAGEYDWSPSRFLQLRRIDPNERSNGGFVAEVSQSVLGAVLIWDYGSFPPFPFAS